ncbi:MAG: hypothetical protein LC797_03770 [Chloroflexi bacterium]|nr:hypothetical protein [Chloroflexota bacterium]
MGAEPGLLRRLVPWLAALGLLAVIAGVTLWARQQDTARRLAEGRADAAEARLAIAEASLTAIERTSAAATATAFAESNQPEAALRRALDLVFEAYKDPSDGRLKALSVAFSPDALSFERTEAEHLISGGMHLIGATPYDMTVLSTTSPSAGDTEIRTREIWTYDEVDAQERRIRCFREESEQTYTLHRVAAGWLVQTVTLSGTTRRTDC